MTRARARIGEHFRRSFRVACPPSLAHVCVFYLSFNLSLAESRDHLQSKIEKALLDDYLIAKTFNLDRFLLLLLIFARPK